VPGDPRIRASDADRDRAAALLREHHAAGRIDAEEFHDRMNKALDAKTLGELDELMADLPAIDLYQLPDASLRRTPVSRQSLLPADQGGSGSPVRFSPGTVAMGGRYLGSGRSLGGDGRGRHRPLVSVVGADRDPVDLGAGQARAASAGIAPGHEVS